MSIAAALPSEVVRYLDAVTEAIERRDTVALQREAQELTRILNRLRNSRATELARALASLDRFDAAPVLCADLACELGRMLM